MDFVPAELIIRGQKLARPKTYQIIEPTRKEVLAQTRAHLLSKGCNDVGSENLNRQFNIGVYALKNPPLPTVVKEHPGACQCCGNDIVDVFVDGVLWDAKCWADLCVDCHKKHGTGLGDGRGQIYQLIDGEFHNLTGWVSTAP